MNITENTHPVIAIAPATNGSALAGDYISMAKCAHVTVMVTITQGNAATCTLTLHQAKDVSGTGVKVLAKDVNISLVADASSSDLMVSQTADVDFTTSADVANKIVMFEVPVESLDVDNDFTTLQVRCGASNAANIVSAMYICSDERYHNKSKIVD